MRRTNGRDVALPDGRSCPVVARAPLQQLTTRSPPPVCAGL